MKKRRSMVLILCVAGALIGGAMADVGLTRRARAFGRLAHLPARVNADEVAAAKRAIDWQRDIATYNCAGLAFGTYRKMTLEEVEGTLARFRPLSSPDAPCPPEWVKVWFWEYDVHHETGDGLVEEPHRDGHVVAGRTSSVDGSGPAVVFCKYNAGPILGPGRPESWVPPEREEVGRNYRGQPIYVVREHMTERWYCAPPSALPQ